MPWALLVGVPLRRCACGEFSRCCRPEALFGFYNSLLVDRFAIYFWYLFLAGAGISILMSVHYLEMEEEHHGEYYALLLLSVVGMMCMAAGIDIVLIFIGLELMAISSYVLVGFSAPRPAFERSGAEVSAARAHFRRASLPTDYRCSMGFPAARIWADHRARSVGRRVRTTRWW
jgi:hypothetical protein